MDNLLLQLQYKITHLLRRCDELEKIAVRAKTESETLFREKELLLAKNQTVLTQIQNIVRNLTTAEKLT
jgi:hypothetical protein